MRVLICPNAFKESLSARAASDAIAAGVRQACPDAQMDLVPLADGGDGTVDALVAATGGEIRRAEVSGPLGPPVIAEYGVLGDGKTAVIEMARASGLALVPPDRRDPRVTTTRGTGELIRAAIDAGFTRIIVGIGGSATNDAGCGMATALGWELLDEAGVPLPPGGAALARLARIDSCNVLPRLNGCEVLAACDVNNPLCGPTGASRVYGPQKGASPEVAMQLDQALHHFAGVVRDQLGVGVLDMPGAGAAGGMGAGLVVFARGRLVPGFDLVADACQLEQRIASADLVITGEGSLDAQSAHGKVPAGVAACAKRHGKPVVAIAGGLGPGFELLYDRGITAAFSLCPSPMSLDEAIGRAAELLAARADAIVRLFMASRM